MIGDNIISSLAYADDLVLFGKTELDLQDSINDLDRACLEYGMKISSSKTKVMHVGKCQKRINCSLSGSIIEQVSEFNYLGCIFSEDGKLDKEFEQRRVNGSKVVSQLRSHIYNKKELSEETKLLIHKSIFRPTILYGSESWVDSGCLINDLEVADMNVLRLISGVSRRDQWEQGIHNEDIRTVFEIESVEEMARRSRLRWYGHVERMNEVRLPKKILYSEANGVRKRGRPRRRFMDSVKSDLQERCLDLNSNIIGLARDRRAWRGVVYGVEAVGPDAERHTRVVNV